MEFLLKRFMKRRGFFGKLAGAAAVLTGAAVTANGKKVTGPEWTGLNKIGKTISNNISIPGDGEWHIIEELTFPITKYLEKSTLSFNIFFTLQQSIDANVGHYFKLRFRDLEGNYLMPDLLTGQTTHSANSPYNCAFQDTIWHQELKKNPLAGEYMIEVFALVGAGVMTLPSTMTTLIVEECPHLKRAGEPVF